MQFVYLNFLRFKICFALDVNRFFPPVVICGTVENGLRCPSCLLRCGGGYCVD